MGSDPGRQRGTGPIGQIGRGGYGLVEVVGATLIVGVLLTASMAALGSATRAGRTTSDHSLGLLLAQDLMTEILGQAYIDPGPNPVFGPESGEDLGTRSAFNDVDDYHGWSASPPQARSGTALPDMQNWQRSVVVQHVDPTDPTELLDDSDDRRLKRIEVTVRFHNRTITTLTAYHSAAWIDTVPDPTNHRTTGSNPPANQPPVAVAAGAPLSGSTPLTVSFDASGSYDPDRDPLTYAWDFGDGTTDSGAMVNRTYTNTTGTTRVFTVTLFVEDSSGAVATDTLTVVVSP